MVTLLRANYPTTGSAPPQPDPPPAPSGSTFDLAIATDFDRTSPVLKNGQVLSGAALQTWKGIDWLIRNHRTKRWVEAGGPTVDQLAAGDDLYHYARVLAHVYNELLTILRLFGDARALDESVRLWLLQKAQLHVGYRSPDTDARWPTHPYRQWRYAQSSGVYRGTDYHPLDNIRTHTPLCQLLLALRQNESETSPAGHDYEQVADDLEDYLDDWVKVWQGPEQDQGIAKNGSAASGWSNNYKGNLHHFYTPGSTSNQRAGVASWDDWPIQSRHHSHVHVGASAAHVWLGKAVPAYATAATIGETGITDLFLVRNLFHFTGSYGDSVVFPHSLHDTGHGELGTGGPGNYPETCTYLGYTIMDLTNLWLGGLIPDYPTVFGTPFTRTLNQYAFSGLNTSQGMQTDILAGNSKTGGAAPSRLSDSGTLDFISALTATTKKRSNGNLVSSAVCQLQAFDTPDDHMEAHVWDRMGRSSLFRDDSDEIGKPRVLSPSIGLLLKQVGAKDWDLTTA